MKRLKQLNQIGLGTEKMVVVVCMSKLGCTGVRKRVLVLLDIGILSLKLALEAHLNQAIHTLQAIQTLLTTLLTASAIKAQAATATPADNAEEQLHVVVAAVEELRICLLITDNLAETAEL